MSTIEGMAREHYNCKPTGDTLLDHSSDCTEAADEHGCGCMRLTKLLDRAVKERSWACIEAIEAWPGYRDDDIQPGGAAASIAAIAAIGGMAERPVNPWVRMVREFHEKFGVPIRETPGLPVEERLNLRQKWLLEEVVETSWGVRGMNLVQIADGLADVIVIALGTAAECGIPMERVMEAVHRANMSKVPNPDGGKILKPDGWVGPEGDIAAALAIPGGGA